MARVTLTPVVMSPQNAAQLAAFNLTTTAAAGVAPNGTGTGNGVQFAMAPGQTFLLVSVGGTATTPTIAAGGIAAAVALNALAINDLSWLGPFYTAMFLSPLTVPPMVAVDFSSVTGVLCTAVQVAPIY